MPFDSEGVPKRVSRPWREPMRPCSGVAPQPAFASRSACSTLACDGSPGISRRVLGSYTSPRSSSEIIYRPNRRGCKPNSSRRERRGVHGGTSRPRGASSIRLRAGLGRGRSANEPKKFLVASGSAGFVHRGDQPSSFVKIFNKHQVVGTFFCSCFHLIFFWCR